MDIIRKKINDAEFTFVVNSRSNRSGFVHECKLFLNDRELSEQKIQYYNRTWERYRFQSVMHSCICDAVEQEKQKIIDREKAARGWQKLTAARKEEIEKIIDANSGVKLLRVLSREVDEASYGTDSERQELEFLDSMLAIVEVLCGARNRESA